MQLQRMGKPVILLIKEIYYPILAAAGVPGNLVTIVILCRGKCGLSNCISAIMLAMATADLQTLPRANANVRLHTKMQNMSGRRPRGSSNP
ncbi:hypothetical protein scyTo_0000461 [Scyliorhinus torazame]|uniref:G-protein coupled receptors family 1 profile domain-containing protein n=1 Tax=Scyliorhinus torazame TaxID=75743 RepID=A0A401NY00_SCYTO|nr:hypothetical protein [Scyliorhinus torazame]